MEEAIQEASPPRADSTMVAAYEATDASEKRLDAQINRVFDLTILLPLALGWMYLASMLTPPPHS